MDSLPVRTLLESFITASKELGQSQFIIGQLHSNSHGFDSGFSPWRTAAPLDARLDSAVLNALRVTGESTLLYIADEIAHLNVPKSSAAEVRRLCAEHRAYLDGSPFLHFWEDNAPTRRLIFETIVGGQGDAHDPSTVSRFESWIVRPDYSEICKVFHSITLRHVEIVIAVSRELQQILTHHF